MGSMSLTEAEIQVLIVLVELAQPVETPNNNHYRFYPKTVEEAATYFKGFREDWSAAYASLVARRLVQKEVETYHLTPTGIALAARVRVERPPIYYWYKEFYTLAPRSAAYREFCERLYGKYLCQANFSDMQQLEKLVEIIDLDPHNRALDLGCGTGMIAEYLSDRTGAYVFGVDYSSEAISQALERTRAKRDRLDFQIANLDALDFPAGSFDALLSIDTLYMPNDLLATLRKLLVMLKPGGQIVVYYSHAIRDASDRTALLPENNPLSIALRTLGLSFRTWDFSEQTYRHLQRKRQLGEYLRPAFEAESNQALYEYIIAESESSSRPFDPQTYQMSRYLYHVRLT